MDNFMDLTKKEGHTPEIQRLTDLHAVYFDALDRQLVVAPLNLQEPGKRILEAGTADGLWLRDLRSCNPVQHHYFGSDIEGELFPQQPDGITYFQHSFNDPWPADLRESMDLVHLRGSLAGASPNTPLSAVENLVTLLKPGGWVQLQELNAWSPPAGNGPAQRDFERMARDVWTGIKVGDFANQLKPMLEQAGLQNVQERRVVCDIGKIAKPELRECSVNGVTSPIRPLSCIAKTVQTSFTDEELDILQGKVREELKNEGGRIEMVIAWGQRV